MSNLQFQTPKEEQTTWFSEETKNDAINTQKEKTSKNKTPPNIYSQKTFCTFNANEVNLQTINNMLEKEKQHNKTETWNKLNKTSKIQKLHMFAEKYGKENNLPIKDVKNLKMFFIDCLEKKKLQKTKDVNYNKETKEVSSIPALFFNISNHNFTLKNMDVKHVSTLKSLTPKRISSTTTEKNMVVETFTQEKKEEQK